MAWAVCVAYSFKRAAKTLSGRLVDTDTHAFFMSSLGNTDLLERHLVAFFASCSVTSEAESRCIAWAESICNTDTVVISGFHSPLEKKILNILLEHKHPVALFLGRAMYKRIPAEYQKAIDEGRMLIDSTTMDVYAKALRLTVDEYERFRAVDAEMIRQMGVKIKNLQAATKHQLEVVAPINAVVCDTVFIRDTVLVVQQKVKMLSPHTQLDAFIDNDRLKVIPDCPLLCGRPYGLNTSVNVSFGRRLRQSTRLYQAMIPVSISSTPNTYK